MSYDYMQVTFSLIASFIMVHAYCSILSMKSDLKFAVIFLALMISSSLAMVVNLPKEIRAFILNPLTTLILPIISSKGALRTRIIRAVVILITMVIPESLGVLTYMLLTKEAYYTVIDASNFIEVIITYIVVISATALTFEILINVFRRLDQEWDSSLRIPIIVFLLLTILLNINFYCKITPKHAVIGYSPSDNAILLIGVVLSLVLALVGYAVYHLARKDAQTHRNLTEQAAITRQIRHMRAEIEMTVQRKAKLLRFRHDLANQLETVKELLGDGNVTEADANLMQLTEQARLLTWDD